ncbi:dolichol-phosphate mannosyltransferase subunit 3-like [Brachionus plicatilis]|uniref:Dolichol-phosphate mannosyltransferase subunit 3 n=1 Tax=Brachionus plicatilis TaxID=10195 RepID=A0A3M7QBB5_BRAPC|nr:dolichol-phosphate mannosyltransferase subunit 3-like [Brachionus plicatilis]
MTKLAQWLFGLTLFLSIWMAILKDLSPIKVTNDNIFWIYLIPVAFVAIFGVVSLLIIIYRVATFNNCDDAAKELTKEINQAKKDLEVKGFKFK